MPAIGRYAELPLPQAWEPVIDGLQPAKLTLSALFLPYLSDLLPTISDVLNSRGYFILLHRYGKGKTLDQIGQDLNLTRERVRQLEKKAVVQLKVSAKDFSDRLQAFTKSVSKAGFIVADMPEEIRLGADLTSEEAWRFALEVYAKAYAKPYITAKVSEDKWIVYDSSRITPDLLKAVFRERSQYLSVSDVAARVGVVSQDLVQAGPFFEGTYLTQSGLLGSSRWTILQFIEAIAWELHKEGFDDWHFSEMARALEIVFPERFKGIISRNVAAAVSRDEATMFQHVGQKGVWQLKSIGDGNRGNREAVIQVFVRNPRLLHRTEVVKLLERRVHPETIYALLQRDKAFRSYGDGFYGLSEEHASYPENKRTDEESALESELELANLLLNIFGENKALITTDSGQDTVQGPDLDTKRENREIREKWEQSPDTKLVEDIVQVIANHTGRPTSREIAKILGKEKSKVSHCLYLHLKKAGRVMHDENRRWYLAHKPYAAPVRIFKAHG